jgi:outer membrane protein OmpA-like peptidoglycan-associated protein
MQSMPDDGIREDVANVESIEPNYGEAQRALDATVADEFALVLPPEDELPASDESAIPTELPAQDDGHQPLEEAVLPEKDQVLFVAFAFDSVDLPPASRETLNHVVKTMSQSRSSVASITGFSDNQGEEAYNLELSRQRANAVEQYLVGEGVEQERLQVKGRGARYDFTDAEISAAGMKSEEYRIVKIRISSGSGSTEL